MKYKYKVGQTVKTKNGQVAKITEFSSFSSCYSLEGLTGIYTEDFLEPFEETVFKVGDTVKIIKKNWTGFGDSLGKTGKITGDFSGEKRFQVFETPGDSTTYLGIYNPDEIELVENPKTERGWKNMAFKVGDKVKSKRLQGACFDGEYTIEQCDNDHSCNLKMSIIDSDYGRCHCDTGWELISNVNETMADVKKLSKAQKEAWTKDQQALYRVGLVNSDGEFLGSDAVAKATARANKALLVKQAEADIAEAEAEEAKEKAKSK